jgi:hypothetical protein
MALARYESVATNTSGDVVPNATVEVRRDQPGRPVVPLWADREGTVALGNPITADGEGKFGFHVTGGSYYIRVFTGPSQQPLQEYVRRYQAIGTAGERDVEDLASALEAGTATYPTLPELQAFVPLEAGIGGNVTTGEDAGFYHYDFTGEAWVFDRPLFDTLARMNVTGGDANDIEAVIASGVADSAVVILWIEAPATNTAPVRINDIPVLTIDEEELLPGQWLAGRTYWFSDEGTFYKLRTESDVSGLVAQAEAAATAAQGAKADAELAQTGAEAARDEAQGYADGLNIAPIAPGDAGKLLQVNVTEDGSDWVDPPSTVPPDGSIAADQISNDPGGQSAILSKLTGTRAANTAGEAKVDGNAKVTALADQERTGLLRWDASVPVATHQGDGKDAIYFPPNDAADGAYVKVVTRGLEARDFDVKPSASAGENGARLQKAVDYAIANGIGLLELPHGDISIGSQILVTGGAGGRARLDIRGQGQKTKLLSSVAGSVIGPANHAGFLFVVDGLRHSTFSDFEIDFTDGNGGIGVRCRNESAFKNTFSRIRFVGSDDATAREVNDRRSIRFVGNEPEAGSTGYVTYFNWVTDCSFNIAYKHIELLDGAGDPGTSEPNANNSRDCLFERYIQAVDLTTMEECIHENNWFQQGQGVSVGAHNGGLPVNGGFTHAYKFNGFGHRLTGTIEPGANGKAFTIGAAASKCQIILIDNVSVAGDDASTGDNLLLLKSTLKLPTLTMGGPIALRSYAKASLPAASPAGQLIYVSNDVGGATLAFSTGSAWLRVQDLAVIS